jgi:hypothetical protein
MAKQPIEDITLSDDEHLQWGKASRPKNAAKDQFEFDQDFVPL